MISWQAKFGAKRRAIDRAILREAELALYGPQKPQDGSPIIFGPSDRQEREAASERLARAFGRPVQ